MAHNWPDLLKAKENAAQAEQQANCGNTAIPAARQPGTGFGSTGLGPGGFGGAGGMDEAFQADGRPSKEALNSPEMRQLIFQLLSEPQQIQALAQVCCILYWSRLVCSVKAMLVELSMIDSSESKHNTESTSLFDYSSTRSTV